MWRRLLIFIPDPAARAAATAVAELAVALERKRNIHALRRRRRLAARARRLAAAQERANEAQRAAAGRLSDALERAERHRDGGG
jgi:hypothetical protein